MDLDLDFRDSKETSSESSLTLLVPIYDEGENTKKLYQGLIESEVNFFKLIFVFDKDNDSSLPYISEINSIDQRVISEKNLYGRGVLNALKFGFSKVETGAVIVLMGDNSDLLSIIPCMVEMWSSDRSVVIVAPSRYMKGGKQFGGGVVKSFLSRVSGKSLKFLGFPISDPTNNFKLYDSNWLNSQKIESTGGFELALELCVKAYAQGRKILEIPTIWRDRTEGKSKFKFFTWLPRYLKWYLRGVLLVVSKLR